MNLRPFLLRVTQKSYTAEQGGGGGGGGFMKWPRTDFQYCNIAVLHFNIAILFLNFGNIALLFKNVVLQYCNIAKSQEVLKCNTLKNDNVFGIFKCRIELEIGEI